MNPITSMRETETTTSERQIARTSWMGRLVAILNRRQGQDIEGHVPASHDDDEFIGAGLLGGGGAGTVFAGLCIATIAGPIMWGVGRAFCDKALFEDWDYPACEVMNSGAILTITAAITWPYLCVVMCCALAVFGLAAAFSS